MSDASAKMQRHRMLSRGTVHPMHSTHNRDQGRNGWCSLTPPLHSWLRMVRHNNLGAVPLTDGASADPRILSNLPSQTTGAKGNPHSAVAGTLQGHKRWSLREHHCTAIHCFLLGSVCADSWTSDRCRKLLNTHSIVSNRPGCNSALCGRHSGAQGLLPGLGCMVRLSSKTSPRKLRRCRTCIVSRCGGAHGRQSTCSCSQTMNPSQIRCNPCPECTVADTHTACTPLLCR
mmetsp:Transcript_54878/g.96187  ORF Transcript_54878/g.96187 Transcript_54878/m.96187 type:complete len:231 (-) Transcript_54878:1362-2054(-)